MIEYKNIYPNTYYAPEGGSEKGPSDAPKKTPNRPKPAEKKTEKKAPGINAEVAQNQAETRKKILTHRERIEAEKAQEVATKKKENIDAFQSLSPEKKSEQLTQAIRDIGKTDEEFRQLFPDDIDEAGKDRIYELIIERYGPDLQVFGDRRKKIQEVLTQQDNIQIVETLLDDEQKKRLETHGIHSVLADLGDEDMSALQYAIGDEFADVQASFIQDFYRDDTSRKLTDLPRFVLEDAVKGDIPMDDLPGLMRGEILTFQADERSLKALSEKIYGGEELSEEDKLHIRYLAAKYSTQESRELANLMDDNLGEDLRLQFLPLTYDASEFDKKAQEAADAGDKEAKQYYENLASEVRGSAGRSEGFAPSNYPSGGSVGTQAYNGNIEGLPQGLTPKEIDGEVPGVLGTGYFPPGENGYASKEEAAMEGGPKDRMGNALRTLQDYLDGNADYVSVAMDPTIANGTVFTSKELNAFFQAKYPDRVPIKLMMCDTGSAFKGKGWSRMDICCADKTQAGQSYINRTHTLTPIDAQTMESGKSYGDQGLTDAEGERINTHPRGVDTQLGNWISDNRINNGSYSCGASVGDALLNYARQSGNQRLYNALPKSGRDGHKWDEFMETLVADGLATRERISSPDEARGGAILAYNNGGQNRSSMAKKYGHVEVKASNGNYVHYLESGGWGGSAGRSVENSRFCGYAYYLTA